MQSITFVIYSIRINGKQSGQIIPFRGLHQDDSLSPYLFLLCVEGLSALIKKAGFDGTMEGVSVYKGGPSLSHLFFYR